MLGSNNHWGFSLEHFNFKNRITRMVQAEASCVLYHTAVWALRSHEVGTHGLSALFSQLSPWESCQHRCPSCLLLLHFGSSSAAPLTLDSLALNWSWRYAHPMHPSVNEWSVPGTKLEIDQRNWNTPFIFFLTWLHYLVIWYLYIES